MPPCTKPHWAGKKTGPNPTDRAKSGTKRHVLTDGGGVPIGLAITAANTPDKAALAELLDARIIRPPAHTEQHLCLDKGYDYADAEEAVRRRRFVPHIRRRGEERRAVGAASGRDGGWSNARTPGSTASASCSSGGRRSHRTTSPSCNSPPFSSCGGLWDRLLGGCAARRVLP